MKTLRRVLKPDGKVIISIRPKDLMKNYPMTRYDFDFFDGQDVVSLFLQAGFSKAEYEAVDEPPQELYGQWLTKSAHILTDPY